jgi:hypothetical protein
MRHTVKREIGETPMLPPQRLASADLPLGHCEQSWEGGKSRLASPDTGLEVYWEVLREAHG